MKKITLLCILILNTIVSFSQYSNITITIDDKDKPFLDSVEVKLLKYLTKIQEDKIECDLSLYTVMSNGNTWCCPMTISESKNYTFPTVKTIATNTYSLDVKWDDTLSGIYVIGFSKIYTHPMYRHDQYYGTLSNIVTCPVYLIPLKEYNKFLSRQELERLYCVVRNEFMEYVNEDTSMYAPAMTIRKLEFNKSDSLAQMPWSNWVNTIYRSIKNGMEHLAVYQNPKCDKPMTKLEADSSLYVYDKIVDTNGNKYLQGMYAELSGVKIAEEWSFDSDNVVLPDGYKCFMKISREIKAIGIIKEKMQPIYSSEQIILGVNPIWLSANDIDRVLQNDGHAKTLMLYKELINSALYRKLKMRYIPN